MGSSGTLGDKTALAFVFACSHEADVGKIACRACRKLGATSRANTRCIPGGGASIHNGFIKNARSADRVLVIDGCESDCARKTLELAGVTVHSHLRLSDLGFVRGLTPVTEENVDFVVAAARPLLFGPLATWEESAS